MKNRSAAYFSCFVLLMLLLSGCIVPPDVPIAKPVSAEQIAAGDIENGRALFMGYAHFENDGPPCMGCHSVGENGLLGGGAMGPDLTNITEERDQSDILSVITNYGWPVSPVMQPIYTDHPLTAREQADVMAFLNSSVGQTETDKELLVIGISLAGFVGAVLALGFLYRNRLRGVRRALVEKGTRGKS
jgi:mono/diheme cytochrome c family protein